MSEGLKRLEARRRMLVLRSEHLREELSYAYGEFAGHFTTIDRAVSAIRRNVSPSILLSLAAISFAFLRRIAPIRWATRGIVALSLVQRILAMIRSRRRSRSLRQ
jgi:hypothetical protein